MQRILINASNLHVGGGVQVAASFLLELSRVRHASDGWEVVVYASTVVDRNLAACGFRREAFERYEVFDIVGFAALAPKNAHFFRGFDLVFTIFGPLYLSHRIKNHLVGFAQPWIIYPNNEVFDRLSLRQRLLVRTKFALQWFFFKRADRLIVELGHVKDRLQAGRGVDPSRIDVVSNCVSSLYFNDMSWSPVPSLQDVAPDVVKIGFVGRDYLHKNLDFLPEVARELERISAKKYRFYVTMSEGEWGARSRGFKEFVSTVGPLTVKQCPTFYRAMDGVIFPSLLECFSATPLEALAMRRPLFASDRKFVRDVCGDHAMYFDPLDPATAAVQIVDWFERRSKDERTGHVERGYCHLLSLPDSRDRARKYLEIFEKQLKLNCCTV